MKYKNNKVKQLTQDDLNKALKIFFKPLELNKTNEDDIKQYSGFLSENNITLLEFNKNNHLGELLFNTAFNGYDLFNYNRNKEMINTLKDKYKDNANFAQFAKYDYIYIEECIKIAKILDLKLEIATHPLNPCIINLYENKGDTYNIKENLVLSYIIAPVVSD